MQGNGIEFWQLIVACVVMLFGIGIPLMTWGTNVNSKLTEMKTKVENFERQRTEDINLRDMRHDESNKKMDDLNDGQKEILKAISDLKIDIEKRNKN